jgi:hypothetical protein
LLLVGLLLNAGVLSTASPAAACSPPFNPTINDVEPSQLVVVGTIGERVDGGRLFHVERAWNGGSLTTPIVIAFKEGEPVGDCSYPVSADTHLIITPWRDGARLSADLGTLQADPESEIGRRYLAEAVARFGPGVVPASLPPPASTDTAAPDVTVAAVGVALGLATLLATVVVLARIRGPGPARP